MMRRASPTAEGVVASGRSARPGRVLRRRRSRTAMVTVALLLALLLLQLVVVGVVHGGARDHDLTARRGELVRAFYAAEAGMNMALREVMLGVDVDGDGGVGTISDDGVDGNDPTVGGGRVCVTAASVGPQIILTSTGRFGLARRAVEAVME